MMIRHNGIGNIKLVYFVPWPFIWNVRGKITKILSEYRTCRPNLKRESKYAAIIFSHCKYVVFFHICHPGVFLLTHIISLLSVIHTIYSIMQTNIQGLHVSTVYGHLQALFLSNVNVLFFNGRRPLTHGMTGTVAS